MPREAVLPADLSQQFIAAYEAVAGRPAIPDWYLNLPKEPRPISEAERIEGLAAIWAHARASFAFWTDFPEDLNWDAEFRRFLPLVAAADDPAEYYRLLRRFTALLREGHSYVMQPPWIDNRVRPAVGINPVEGQPVVVRGNGLPVGAVITSVDDVPVTELLPDLLALACSAADHSRLCQAMGALLEGPRGSQVRVGARLPDGAETVAILTRDGALPAAPLFEREDLPGGVALVRIGAWHPERVVELFHQAFPDFLGVRGIIFDLRRNGGGNSAFGDAVLARLIDQPVERNIVSYQPLHWGSMQGLGLGAPVLTEHWRPLAPDTTRPRYAGPVAVLTGMQTVSAGEDFAATFRLAGRGPLVGEPTAGSTGTPAIFPLPGGGVGAVSSTRCVYPGRAAFHGCGLAPDVPVSPTIAGLAAGRDEVLEAALAVLKA
jgi:carboxyl-terminal processing protease